jgi:hypothetical protein
MSGLTPMGLRAHGPYCEPLWTRDSKKEQIMDVKFELVEEASVSKDTQGLPLEVDMDNSGSTPQTFFHT